MTQLVFKTYVLNAYILCVYNCNIINTMHIFPFTICTIYCIIIVQLCTPDLWSQPRRSVGETRCPVAPSCWQPFPAERDDGMQYSTSRRSAQVSKVTTIDGVVFDTSRLSS